MLSAPQLALYLPQSLLPEIARRRRRKMSEGVRSLRKGWGIGTVVSGIVLLVTQIFRDGKRHILPSPALYT